MKPLILVSGILEDSSGLKKSRIDLLFIVSGFIIGGVMGLTGAGGALVSLPIFMGFFGMTLKEASLYSLVGVIISSALNFFPQRKFAKFKLSFWLVLFSSVGSLISTPFKKMMPDFYITIILMILSVISLYTVWVPKKINEKIKKTKNSYFVWIAGLALGGLTTITGLGGGVILVPFYLRFCELDFKEAAATSIVTIFFSSLISLLFQTYSGAHFNLNGDILFLAFGMGMSVIIIGKITALVPEMWMVRIRKLTFSGVVFFSILKILSL